MTNEQINVAIAQACGWTPDNRGLGWLSPHGYYAPEPDYCNCLNAMHEAEKVLTGSQFKLYSHWVENLMPHSGIRFLLCATASQRAEAFLRTVGKWEEVQS
jgi:hypothetical protein